MFEIVGQFIGGTLEFQDWGWNAVTISFGLSLIVIAVSAWGLIKQNKTIWQRRAAESVSVVWLSYYAVLQLVILTYGLHINSLALVINGLLFVLFVPVLVGLWKFKGFSSSDKLAVALFVLALAAMMALPYKPQFFLGFAIGGLLSAAAQPLEIWRKRSSAGVDVRLLYTVQFGNIVWFSYGLAVSDWVLITINAIAFGLFGTTIYLAHRFKPEMK